MQVIRAKRAGFCMGVARALNMLEEALTVQIGTGSIYTFGPIIHNPLVQDAFARRGVGCTEQAADIQRGDTVVIRAHGLPVPVERKLVAAGARLMDATCPHVKRAQQGIAAQTEEGRSLLLLGEENHPEVRGLVSYALPGYIIFDSLEALCARPPDKGKHWFLAAQTTQELDEFQRVSDWVRRELDADIPILSTICGATRQRQEEARTLAADVEAMVVVGGLDSGNTRRLAHVAQEAGIPSFHVEQPDAALAAAIRGFQRVGLTAGASTPKSQIDEMQAFLEACT